MASKKKASKKVVRKARVEYHVPRPDHVGEVVKFVPAVEPVPTFESMLRDIATFLNLGTSDSEKLWYVLTALRGPDFVPGHNIKLATTAVIRHAVGLTTDSNLPASVNPDEAKYVVERRLPYSSFHFESHARNAFDALGLKWNELN